MPAERLALIPECAECGARWLPADKERWEAYLTDDEPPELAFYKYGRRKRVGAFGRTSPASPARESRAS